MFRAHLVALVVALIIPIPLFAAVLFTQLSQSERCRYETEALEVARRLTAVLDRDLQRFIRNPSELYGQQPS
jgi:hypothetical protein